MRSSSYVGVKYDNFTSFLISLCIYFLAGFFLLFNAIRDHELALKYTDDPNAYMDIIVDWEIDDSAPKAPDLAKEVPAQPQVEEKPKEIEKTEEPKPEPLPEPKPVETPIEEPKPVEEPKPEPKPNLNDLFADTTKDNKKLQESTEKKEEEKESGSKNAVQKDDKKSGKSQMTGKFDAFKGGVEKKLKILWSRYSAKSNDDALVSITIDANGKVIDYEILMLSYNSEFNQKLRDFMSSLDMHDFPKPPDGKPFKFDKINLSDKI
ncbi:MAG: TonB C-terminal domain-containing protein [Campylobacter sp.]|nr:TonB C-terminal domain-containing protein [Campylobacter sp.]